MVSVTRSTVNRPDVSSDVFSILCDKSRIRHWGEIWGRIWGLSGSQKSRRPRALSLSLRIRYLNLFMEIAVQSMTASRCIEVA